MQTFTDYLRVQGLRPRSICQYRQIVNRWMGSDLEPAEYCARDDPSAQTHNQRAAAIRHYYSYCQDEPPPIPSWKIRSEPPRYLSIDEMLAWLGEIRRLGLRDYAAACLLYSAGLRIGELISLELEDLDLERKIARVHGKGGKVRQVPFDGEVTVPALRMYLNWIRPGLCRKATQDIPGIILEPSSTSDSNADQCSGPAVDDISPIRKKLVHLESPARVFLADHGGEYQSRMLTRVVRQAAKRADLPEFKRPLHQLRHAFATHTLEGGLAVNQLMALLGHVNLATTQIYVAVNMTDIRENYEKAHPLAKGRKPKVGLELLEDTS